MKSPTPLPFLHLSADDSPHDGADVTVLGYPLVGELSTHIKITRGIVSSGSEDEGNGADVLMDAKVNPGNSGGPILDHFGNVMAIVCMKTLTSGTQDSYGIGISAGHIREFLSRNNINLDPGAVAVHDGDVVADRDQHHVGQASPEHHADGPVCGPAPQLHVAPERHCPEHRPIREAREEPRLQLRRSRRSDDRARDHG